MLSSLLSVLIIAVLAIVFIMLLLVICLAASPKDRKEEDIEQMNFLKRYLNGKDERN